MKKKIITITAIFMLLHTAVAFAAIPFVLSAAVRSAPAIIRGGTTLLLAPSGSILKYGTADNYGVKRSMVAKVGAAAGILVTGYMAYNDIKALVNANQAEYSNLSKALVKDTSQPLSGNTKPNSKEVGSIVSYNGYNYALQSYVFYPDRGCTNACNAEGGDAVSISTYQNTMYVRISHPYGGGQDSYTYTVTNAPTTSPATADQFASAVNNMTLDEIYPQYQPELDKLMQNNPDKVQTPSDLTTQIADAEREVAKGDISNNNAATVNGAQAAKDAAQAAYNADPSPENLNKLNEAQAALDKAKAAAAQSQLSNTTPQDPQAPELKQINFTPLYDLGKDLSDKFPFSLLKTIKAIADGFVTSPKAPEFSITFPAPFNHEWKFSLARWDGIAETIRFLIAATFLCYTVMTIIRRWK